MPLAGKPMLQYLVDRLIRVNRLDIVVITTSTSREDDEVASFAKTVGVPCYRGALDDVASRMLDAARQFGLEAFVRVSGDSPFLDRTLVEKGLNMRRTRTDPDLVTNVFPRTYPTGQSVEVVSTNALQRAIPMAETEADLEHVTTPMYRHPQRFSIFNFSRTPPLDRIRLTIDTPEDAARADRLLRSLQREHWTYGLEDLLEHMQETGTEETN